MRLIVTGNQGQVVSSLIERGPAHGVEIVAIGRPELDLADPASIEAALAHVEGDMLNLSSGPSLKNVSLN